MTTFRIPSHYFPSSVTLEIREDAENKALTALVIEEGTCRSNITVPRDEILDALMTRPEVDANRRIRELEEQLAEARRMLQVSEEHVQGYQEEHAELKRKAAQLPSAPALVYVATDGTITEISQALIDDRREREIARALVQIATHHFNLADHNDELGVARSS